MGNKVGGFIKLFTEGKKRAGVISEAELPIDCDADGTLVWLWFCVCCPLTRFLSSNISACLTEEEVTAENITCTT